MVKENAIRGEGFDNYREIIGRFGSVWKTADTLMHLLQGSLATRLVIGFIARYTNNLHKGLTLMCDIYDLVENFSNNIDYYKNPRNYYNESSCRLEFIDPFFKLLGWDVTNTRGLEPQYREVIVENFANGDDRPDYTFTLRGVPKFFVEAKKPSVDISRAAQPAFQTRRYGWNANHKIAVLTNFEYLVIYDTSHVPSENDPATIARYRLYHYTEYAEKMDEISALISRNAVYSGRFDEFFDENFPATGGDLQKVDELFLKQINGWRVSLSNELYATGGRFADLEVLNDVVQEFINQVVFLRICEDKNLPLYHKLSDTISDGPELHAKLEELFRDADHRYNSGMFAGEDIIFDLSSTTIMNMISALYYPQSLYLFNIIEPNLLGKTYEMFLTEQLIQTVEGIRLAPKEDYRDRSVVSTPPEIVKYMVEKVLSEVCVGKTPEEILSVRIADIACGSGIFLEEAFEYLQDHCINWYLHSGQEEHLLDMGNGQFKLPLEEKKDILCSCIYGIDIDDHAVEVAKFSLLIKLIEGETAPTVTDVMPILPNLDNNICFGNSLVSPEDLEGITERIEDLIGILPFEWDSINNGDLFDAIIGNPPYVNTSGMHSLVSEEEFTVYKKSYQTSYKQFDKYFIFIEQALRKVKENGWIGYIVPNKFFKIGAGEKLRDLIAQNKWLVNLDDFGDAQLFDDRTIYSSILVMQKSQHDTFVYSTIDSAERLWSGEEVNSVELRSTILNELPWRLTTDLDFLRMLQRLDNISVPITDYVEIFNGIQTSAERPVPIYWFATKDIVNETESTYEIVRNGNHYQIEKGILKPFFKPTSRAEGNLNSYSLLSTDKHIIFPYDTHGRLIPIDEMQVHYPGTYRYLLDNYDRLVPKCVSASGTRDVPNATADTWYQYGRTQALTSFIDKPKLIAGVLSRNAMYIIDENDTLIASGGTAGYVGISQKLGSPYALEYIQAWLSNPITERLVEIVGSDFEGGFYSRGSSVLSKLPFVELDLNNESQKDIYDQVVQKSCEIYGINDVLSIGPARAVAYTLTAQKTRKIREIETLIERVYNLDF